MNWTGKRLAELRAAFMLLSCLPVGKFKTHVPKLEYALWAFPIVGFFVGGIIAGSYFIISQIIFSTFAAAIFALIAGLLFTGAIHEDGLADCADGFGGGQNREKKLAIMEDSAVGSFGMLALIMVMGLRILMLSSLPAAPETVISIIICAVVSRFAMVGYLCLLPAARQKGLGNQASTDKLSSLFLAAVIALPAFYISFFNLMYATIAILVVAFAWGIVAKKQIGGQTGDVCGAGQLLSETAGWVILTSIYGEL